VATSFFGGGFFSGEFYNTAPVVDTGVNGAPWWEAENAKKKKRIEDTLNKEREDANNAAIILLMLKG
jgi:hypothetical protein